MATSAKPPTVRFSGSPDPARTVRFLRQLIERAEQARAEKARKGETAA